LLIIIKILTFLYDISNIVADVKGFKKGNLSEALEGAIDLWIEARLYSRLK
jgi:hypothetical protein